jgi:predicted transcriptional regulator
MDKTLVSTRLAPQTYHALQQLAQQQERKVAFLVRKAVEQYIQQQRKGRQAA